MTGEVFCACQVAKSVPENDMADPPEAGKEGQGKQVNTLIWCVDLTVFTGSLRSLYRSDRSVVGSVCYAQTS